MARPGSRESAGHHSVGQVVAITPKGTWTVRAEGPDFPNEGTILVDRTGRYRGKVARIFGPVSRPYLEVRPKRNPDPAGALALIGSSLMDEELRGKAVAARGFGRER